MEILIITALAIISLFVSGGIIVYMNFQLKKAEKTIQSLKEEKGLLKQKLDHYVKEQERAFRLTLKTPVECPFQIKQLNERHIDIDKKTIGNIVNISRTGMLFETDFDFPIEKSDILLEFEFTLDKENFFILGKLIRKEIKSKNKKFYYGVIFDDVPNKVGRELSTCINRIHIIQNQYKAS